MPSVSGTGRTDGAQRRVTGITGKCAEWRYGITPLVQIREGEMTKSARRNFMTAVAILSVMAMPGAALAGGKGGGGGHSAGSKPSESMTLNYGKIEHTYSQQSASKKSGTTKEKPQQYMKYEMHDVYISHY